MYKKSFLLLVAAVVGLSLAHGQGLSKSNWQFGVTANYLQNFVQATAKKGPPDSRLGGIDGRSGWTAGVFAERQMNNKWRIKTNLQYSKQGYDNANSDGSGLILDSKHTLHHLQADALLHFSPFWRYPIGLTVFAGPVFQIRQGYSAELFTVKAVAAPNPPFYVSSWESSNTPLEGMTLNPFVIGGQVGVAYQHKRLGFQVAYQKMLSSSLTENRGRLFDYQFASLQLGLSYRILGL